MLAVAESQTIAGGLVMGKRILLVSSEPGISWGAAHALISEGHFVVVAGDASDAMKQVADGKFDVGVIDAEIQGPIDGAAFTGRLSKSAPAMEILLIAAGAPPQVGRRITVLPRPESLCNIRAIAQVIEASCARMANARSGRGGRSQ
jgi:CheY-like chemotaxis protein